MGVPCSFIYKSEKLETTKCSTLVNWLGKLQFIHRMEYFVAVKNVVYRDFNDMQKCLWYIP